jgi:hypothetical protein
MHPVTALSFSAYSCSLPILTPAAIHAWLRWNRNTIPKLPKFGRFPSTLTPRGRHEGALGGFIGFAFQLPPA